jgi:hypothetical protein
MFQLDFPGVKIEAVKVVGTCKASTPNQLITYFDESHIDLDNAVQTVGQKEAIDIKVTRLNFSPPLIFGGRVINDLSEISASSNSIKTMVLRHVTPCSFVDKYQTLANISRRWCIIFLWADL